MTRTTSHRRFRQQLTIIFEAQVDKVGAKVWYKHWIYVTQYMLLGNNAHHGSKTSIVEKTSSCVLEHTSNRSLSKILHS